MGLRKNKKAALGIIITTFVLLVVWFFLFIILDTIDYIGDDLINQTWEDSKGQDWYDEYGTFTDSRTNMKEILFPIGLVIIVSAGIGAAYRQKVTQFQR